ncbi:MAG: aminoglycoside phosphotransferase family protein [Rhodospirillales bacterium]|nr:aminoglycoside phosphotransferase family protein [Rhodospirillales bacterium]
MRLPTHIRDNLYFLLAEANSQIGNLKVLLETGTSSAAQRILDRRGYTYNLKMRIHDSCINEVRQSHRKDTLDVYSLRSAEAIASELEWLSDLGQDCVREVSQHQGRKVFKRILSAKLLETLVKGLQLIKTSLEEDNSEQALKVGKIGRKINRQYKSLYKRQTRDLKKKKNAGKVISTLFIAHRLKEMGAVLLDISEAIISAKLGHPMHMERFKSLETAFEDLGIDDASVDSIAETNSGSGISGIADNDHGQEGYAAIFKDGRKDKLKEERESVESWHEIFPGLAPQILSYRKRGANASMLIEHLPGHTFEQVLLNESDEILDKTLKHLTKTLKAVWKETKRSKKSNANHMGQLSKRLPSIREVHRGLGQGGTTVCGAPNLALEKLIEEAAGIEAKCPAPFSVYIHGDFNLDNIIFDPGEKRINFIDLHRSCYSDYTQDVSVFMVSNYRLQVFNKRTRKRISEVALRFYEFAAEYAEKNKDKTFEFRLALGLARSFITSTRFILDKSLAKAMYLRGYYILERLSKCNKKSIETFKLPIKELF